MDFMWIPCEISPCGFHVDSMWNKSIPHGIHVECGGMVKYWILVSIVLVTGVVKGDGRGGGGLFTS
jgi:hypothetical protein